jgi:hypothetical protein
MLILDAHLYRNGLVRCLEGAAVSEDGPRANQREILHGTWKVQMTQS